MRKLKLIIIHTTIVILFIGCGNRGIDSKYYTSCYGKADFTESYINNYNNKIHVEVPIVYELVHVLMALTEHGLEDEYLINKKGRYYQDVMEYFNNFKDYDIIKTTQEELKQRGYYYIKNYSFAYIVNDGKIENEGIYINELSFIEKNKDAIEEFVRDSDFEVFYENNLGFYNRQIDIFEETVPLYDMKKWMEKNYPNSYNSYHIIFSPLTGASHNTFRYRDENDNFEEAMIFSASPDYYETHLSDKIKKGIFMSNVFTEINHNYVNPLTDEKIIDVIKAFKKVEKWNTQKGYKYPTLTFNEYMTWSLFLLYAYENLDETEFKNVKEYQQLLMIKGRGFIKYNEFSEKLLDIYLNNKKVKICDLTDEILEWSKKQ